MDITSFKEKMLREGFAIFPDILQQKLVLRLREALESTYPSYREIHNRMGYTGETEGGAHHILIHKGYFLQLLQELDVIEYIKEYLGGQIIVNSYGAFDNVRGNKLYLKKCHRDVRSFEHDPRMLNLLVMLDEFTIENGATYMLAGSHLVDLRPEEDLFFLNAARAVGGAGSILLFDSRLWHAAGSNTTDQHRRAITITFTRPYFKQQFDYCRAMGHDFCETLPESLKQLIGFYSRVPADLEEWYQPLQKRFYKSNQD